MSFLSSPTPCEITLSFCLFGSIVLAPLLSSDCSSFRENEKVSSHPLLKFNFLSLLAVWLFCSPY